MTSIKYYNCNLCDNIIEGYTLFGKFISNDGEKLKDGYYCSGNCKDIAKYKFDEEYISERNYFLKIIFLYFIFIKYNVFSFY